MAKYLVPTVASTLAVTLVGGGIWAANAFATTPVTLTVDGAPQQLEVRASTVKDVLDSQGIALSEHDVVQPALDTAVARDLAISVQFARPFEVTLDGTKTVYWTTATNVGDALSQLKLASDADKLSTSRSLSIGREGLAMSIVTAKNVTVTAAGAPTSITLAGTVGDALKQLGITPDADDIVTPSADSPLSEGGQIVYKKVDVNTVTKTVEVAFNKTTAKSDSMYTDQSKITTKGVAGQATQQVQETYIDGALADSKVLSSTTTKAPVDQVTTVGTQTRPTSSSSSSSSSSSDLTAASGATCKASYYWQGQMTANGEQFNTNDFTAAHKTLPFGTRVKVTNLANGQTTIVRINDRGPYISGRCLDLSKAAMSAIGGISAGVVTVAYEVL